MIVAADNSKLGRVTFVSLAALSQVDIIVTDGPSDYPTRWRPVAPASTSSACRPTRFAGDMTADRAAHHIDPTGQCRWRGDGTYFANDRVFENRAENSRVEELMGVAKSFRATL